LGVIEARLTASPGISSFLAAPTLDVGRQTLQAAPDPLVRTHAQGVPVSGGSGTPGKFGQMCLVLAPDNSVASVWTCFAGPPANTWRVASNPPTQAQIMALLQGTEPNRIDPALLPDALAANAGDPNGYATESLDLSPTFAAGNFSQGDTITVGDLTYSFWYGGNAQNEIAIGVNFNETLANLLNALAVHPLVTARFVGSADLEVKARLPGEGGNLIQVAASLAAGGDWYSPTLTGGGIAIPGLFVGQHLRVGSVPPFDWYVWNGASWDRTAGEQEQRQWLVISEFAPSHPFEGMTWIDTNGWIESVWVSDFDEYDNDQGYWVTNTPLPRIGGLLTWNGNLLGWTDPDTDTFHFLIWTPD